MDDFLLRLLRGGSWYDHPRSCRAAFRILSHPDDVNDSGGFRVVCLSQANDHAIRLEEQADDFYLVRGGSWFDRKWSCRLAYRFPVLPHIAIAFVGFRVVCLPQANDHTIRLGGTADA